MEDNHTGTDKDSSTRETTLGGSSMEETLADSSTVMREGVRTEVSVATLLILVTMAMSSKISAPLRVRTPISMTMHRRSRSPIGMAMRWIHRQMISVVTVVHTEVDTPHPLLKGVEPWVELLGDSQLRQKKL